MPAKSKAQRKAMAIAEHRPKELFAENKGLAKMSQSQLHDFAATKESKLPAHKQEHQGRGATSKHAPFGRKPNSRY